MDSNKHIEISSKGGSKTLKKYGKKHFKQLAKLSWEKRRKRAKKLAK